MPDDFLTVLARFHRDVMLPDVERVVSTVVDTRVGSLSNEMLSHFDALYQRLDRLETEYQALSAAVRRLEDRFESLEQKLALRSELVVLKDRVAQLEQRIADLEAEL